MLCSHPTKLKLHRIVKYVKQIINRLLFDDCLYSEEIIDVFPHLKKALTLAFSWTPIKQDLSDFA